MGSGSIGLAGNGRLIDWEIFNRPSKGSSHGFSHFAVKAERNGKLLDARILHGDLNPPYTGEFQAKGRSRFGTGPRREYLSGIPHFNETEFRGEYPFATLDFTEPKFPGGVSLTAFNPFIPLNDGDSSIPAAFFDIEIANPTKEPIRYTVSGTLKNPFPANRTVNTFQEHEKIPLIKLHSTDMNENNPEFGDMTIAVSFKKDHAAQSDSVSYQEYWYRGGWFDNLLVYWQDFTRTASFINRTYEPAFGKNISDFEEGDHCSLAAHFDVAPGKSGAARFTITWNFPNVSNYWNPQQNESVDCSGDKCCAECETDAETWQNYYATVFPDSQDSALYCHRNWDRLLGETETFHKSLFTSTLPKSVLDAVSANISILKTPTVLRLEDGTFYGFEGCNADSGCCEGSCTHVWNYAYALPFLFPNMERSMRDIDFKYNMSTDGGMSFRLQLPLGRKPEKFRPCADGQFGGVMKMYREWKISGDGEWLRSHWDNIKQTIAFAWAESNRDKWDTNRDGVLEGRQHHTLDMELFGPNSWLTGFYLGALLAAGEMAAYLGDGEAEKEYQDLFTKGKRWADANLFNGEYYHQLIDLSDKSIIESFRHPDEFGVINSGNDGIDAYWSAEHGEIKYQVAEGCGIDQVVAQWHANVMGLGEIFDREQTKTALQSIYKYNFKNSMRDYVNPCRVYSLQDEAATVICDYPASSPVIPVPYAQETMNGFEYQAACHMIQEGMVNEGLELVAAVRDRYDGNKRNPWNEFECGSNYARSMASFALLPTISGFSFDMVQGEIGFDPIPMPPPNENDRYRFPWSLDPAWGCYSQNPQKAEIEILGGEMKLHSVKLPQVAKRGVRSIVCNKTEISFRIETDTIYFSEPITLGKNDVLTVSIDGS